MTQKRFLQWQGTSLKDLREFPNEVEDLMGAALLDAQYGDTHPDAELMRGEFSGVYAIHADDASGTYRVMYIAKLKHAVYVLHAFHKKSPHGVEMPQKDRHLLLQRLRDARNEDAKRDQYQ